LWFARADQHAADSNPAANPASNPASNTLARMTRAEHQEHA
jgi:hypothetical protein